MESLVVGNLLHSVVEDLPYRSYEKLSGDYSPQLFEASEVLSKIAETQDIPEVVKPGHVKRTQTHDGISDPDEASG